MAVLVAGCGAIGGMFAGYLARVVPVWVWDPWVEHVAAMNRDGLHLTTPDRGEWTAKVTAVADGKLLRNEPIEAVIVAVKSTSTRKAIAAVAPYLSDPLYLSVQNGLGNEEVIAEVSGGRVSQGVTMNAATLIGPGRVKQELVGATWFGPHTNSRLADCQGLAQSMVESGMEAHAVEDARGAIWTKFLFNVGINPVTALTRLPSAISITLDETRELIRGLIEEGKALAVAQGIELMHDPVERALRPRPAGSMHYASMAQDIFRGQATEIEVLNGAIVREAQKLGVEVPLNLAISRLIRGLEHSLELPNVPGGSTGAP